MYIKTMGVINITPDSFSDGDLFNTRDSFIKKWQELSSWADIIDIGAESTAPMNQAIDSTQELERHQKIFFPILESLEDPELTLSIDTYKVEVFTEVAKKVHQYWPKTKLIFNDVSGAIDDQLIDCLTNFEIPFSYVYSHNLTPERSKAGNHMQFISPAQGDEFVEQISAYFKSAVEKLKDCGRKIYLDPCFGFSKTREQNHVLLKAMPSILQEFSSFGFIYAISRKSFLRFPLGMDAKDSKNQMILDHMQSILIFDFLKSINKGEIIFRVHDAGSMTAVKNVQKMFDL